MVHFNHGYERSDDPRVRRWSSIWKDMHLRFDRIVLLERENELERFVSLKVSFIRKQWVYPTSSKPPAPVPPFYLDPDETFRWLKRLRHMVRSKLDRFKDVPQHRLTYDNLYQNPQAELDAVFEFLGVPSHPVQPDQLKVGIPLEEQLTNYAEVKAAFDRYLAETR
jgi:hypothetical protein